jgi:lipid II:glycine glycyltransferase (peptidoglycan interpeptide bridge formation enzyme)
MIDRTCSDIYDDFAAIEERLALLREQCAAMRAEAARVREAIRASRERIERAWAMHRAAVSRDDARGGR